MIQHSELEKHIQDTPHNTDALLDLFQHRHLEKLKNKIDEFNNLTILKNNELIKNAFNDLLLELTNKLKQVIDDIVWFNSKNYLSNTLQAILYSTTINLIDDTINLLNIIKVEITNWDENSRKNCLKALTSFQATYAHTNHRWENFFRALGAFVTAIIIAAIVTALALCCIVLGLRHPATLSKSATFLCAAIASAFGLISASIFFCSTDIEAHSKHLLFKPSNLDKAANNMTNSLIRFMTEANLVADNSLKK